jgi:hypothetical protein
VRNCGVDGCQAAHHHLLHGALVEGRVMVVQGIGARKAKVFLCHEDVRVEGQAEQAACMPSTTGVPRSPW